MKPLDVIATISDQVAVPDRLQGLVERGATILRINGAHASVQDAVHLIAVIRKSVGRRAKILVDLPGNKIRTANLDRPLTLEAGQPFRLEASQFNYPGFLTHLKPGDELLASDGRLRFVVEACGRERVTLVPLYGGLLESNKGVHLVGLHPPLPFLFEYDRALIQMAREQGADFVGLSYVRQASHVEEAYKLLEGSPMEFICKIETREACEELDRILPLTRHVLIDRGDLSSEIGLYRMPRMERLIAARAAARGVKVFVATQILYNMVQYPIPLMAEVSALHELATYADGIQLSDETAVGKYPFEVLEVIRRMRETACREQTAAGPDGAGVVVWLTGRSGSGKTTLATALFKRLQARGIRTVLMDGDEARSFTQGALGYTRKERESHLRYLAFASQKAVESGALVIVAALSPFEHVRQWTRSAVSNYFEIYLDCPLDECTRRDPKGHYAKATRGELADFVGVDMEYEIPRTPDLVLDSGQGTVEACADQIMLELGKAGLLSVSGPS
jgi:pyruvate kinase